MEISSLMRDSARVEQGEWIGDLAGMGDLRVKVRGLNNSDYRFLQTKLLAALPPKRRRNNVVHPDDQDRIQSKCLLETILLDWEGVLLDGQPVPYSKEMAEKFLKFPEFRTAVANAADLVGVESEEENENLEKKSAPPSNGV